MYLVVFVLICLMLSVFDSGRCIMDEAQLDEYIREHLKLVVKDDYDPHANATSFEIKLVLKDKEVSRDSIYIRH